MKTIAVGPFDPAEFCVTGGLCVVARHLAVWAGLFGRRSGDPREVVREMLLESIVADCRKAMTTVNEAYSTVCKVTSESMSREPALGTVERGIERRNTLDDVSSRVHG